MRDDQDFSHRIAIIGMAGRFPGAPDVDTFWRNLCAGHEALVRYSRDDINRAIEACDHGSKAQLMQQVRSGNWVGAGFRLDDIDKFDATFFGYTPAEAELLDPQQRLFLETAWAALEDAATIPDAWERPVGIFGGASLSRYFINNVYANRDIVYSERDLTAGIGNEPDYITNRVAYKLNLTGPAVSVQTACSTSLVAIHLACQSLLAGECDLALAGGVLVTVPGGGYLYREGSMASSDGHIRAFDARAEGTVFSEAGVGIVCLKRLEDALADGDHIHAVIRGSAVANDGSFKAGYTAPGIDGQVRVISEALAVGGVAADEVTYVEAHGTGTPLGDPIEISALTRAFRQSTERRQYCAIGSLKPNVGHLAPAAGVAGVIKAALAVKHGVLPPSINYAEPNPRIDFASSPFFVNHTLQPWTAPGSRIAGVSSFGIGGTNAHVILEQPPEVASVAQEEQRVRQFPLSARTPAALQQQAANLAAHVEQHPDLALRDLAHTLRVGRKAFEYRAAPAALTRDDLVADLLAIATGNPASRTLPATSKVCWMFSGQGSQYAGMGRGLYAELPEFRARLDECCELLAPHVGIDLRNLLFPAEATEALSAQLNQTRYAQPALFAFEYALARQLEALGFAPHAMLGHSLGEYVAACLAGVFQLPQALRLVALRGELMQSMPPGAMLSVSLDASALAEYCDGEVGIAAINAPKTCVLSGPHPRIEALAQRLSDAGVGHRVLHTSHAFHSEMMRPAAERFAAAVERAAPQAPQRPYLSNVTGTWITAEQVRDPQYWSAHLLGSVHFQPALETLLDDGTGVFVEVGPGNVLTTFARRTAGARRSEAQAIELTRHPQEQTDDRRGFERALGKLWAAGQSLDWARIAGEADARRVPLPTYPFARERHWVDAPAAPAGSGGALGKQEQVERWLSVPSWKRQAAGLPAAQWQRSGSVLLFADDNVVTNALEQALAKLGNPVIRVASGTEFVRDGEQRFRIVPGEPRHYEQVLQALAPAPVAAVIHAWNLTARSTLARNNLDAHTERAFYSLLHLVQALSDAGFEGRLPLLTLSNEVHEVHAEDQLNPGKATLLGVHLCLGYENPRCNSRNLDFDADVLGAKAPARLANWIVAELCALAAEERLLIGATEKCVAYRQGYRWLAQFEPAPLPQLQESLQLDPGRAYVVTGGLGGLGLDSAEFLAERGATKIALLGRSRLPERAEWKAQMAQNPADATSRKLAKLLALEARGVTVEVVQADVADAEQMRAAIAAVRARLGPVAGAIHCAGIAGGGMLQLKTRAAAEQVLRPKLHGLLALHEALDEEPLDFLVLFSSLYAVLGGLGQVDYSAANNFLDAYARNEWLQRGRRVMSINWGGWSEVGMAAGQAPPMPAGKTLDHPYLFSARERSEQGAHYVALLREDDHWALQEHRIGGRAVLPGTALVEMVRAAFRDYRGAEQVALENLYFFRPLVVASASLAEISVRFERGAGERFRFNVSEAAGAPIVSGEVMALQDEPVKADLQGWQASCVQETVEFAEDAAQVLQSDGFLQLGPRWQVIRRIAFGADSLLGELKLPEAYASDLDAFTLHPSLLDMATGPITGHLLARMDLGLSGEYLPFSYTRFEQRGRLSGTLQTHVRFRNVSEDRETIELDIAIANESGEEVVRLQGFALKRVPAAALAGAPARGESIDFVDDRIHPQEGREVLARVLGATAFQPQWIVSTQELPALMGQIAERANAQGGERTRPRPAHAAATVTPPTNPVEAALVEILAQVLGIDAVGIDDNFFELGGDSVMGIQVVAHAKARGLILKPAQLFEHQTVARLAQAIGASTGDPAAAPPAQPQGDGSAASEVSKEDLETLLDAIAA